MVLSKYEQEREANIQKNRALLAELGIHEDAVALAKDLEPPTKPKANPAMKRQKRPREEAEAPRRQSLRLKKEVIDPNESPAKRKAREAEVERRRQQEEEDRLAAEEQARLAKRPRHDDLDIVTLMPNGDEEEIDGLASTLHSLSSSSFPKHDVQRQNFFYDNNHEKAEVDALKKRFQKMKIASIAKLTQDRIYSSAYHPEKTKDVIFFGDKSGRLIVWDALAPVDEDLDEDEQLATQKNAGKSYTLEPHHPVSSNSSISCIKFDPINSSNVYTSSYDSSIRRTPFDVKKARSEEIFAMDRILINSFDFVPTGNEIWASDELGGLSHIDLREEKSKARRWELSEKKTGCVSINPTQPSMLLVSSNSRVLKIWDSRKLMDMPALESAEDYPPTYDVNTVETYNTENFRTRLAECPHNKSVTAAYWDPSGRHIVSTCYDDRLRLWDVSSQIKTSSVFSTFKPFGQIMHDCQTGRWVSMLKATWTPNPDVYPHFTIGNMKHSLDIFSGKGELLARLSDPTLITAVQAVTCSHPNIVERAASGNASGKCILWAPLADLDR